MTDIDNSEDTIDSRDIIARFEELEGERGTLADAVEDAQTDVTLASHGDDDGDPSGEIGDAFALARKELADWDDENGEEFSILKKVCEQGDDYASDWHHGETLIRDSYFKEYAQELAEELDLIKSDSKWPATCIDWDQAARELQMDYTAIDYDGITYWIR